MKQFIAELPKAELHVHIEGTLEPELTFQLAKRNRLTLPYDSIESLRAAYQFSDLTSFLDLYYAGMKVLKTEEDFFDLANAYFERAREHNVVHAELFFDPQAHTKRGVAFDTVIDGLWSAVSRSQDHFGISSKLIMCFLRDMSAEDAMETLEIAVPYGDRIVAVGLDSTEVGNPPSKFKAVFQRAKAEGFLTVAHAGEEGPADYVWEAIDQLKVSRIDHGVRSLEDPQLTRRLVETRIPLTVCPMSNIKLRVFDDMTQHNLKEMLDLGICATINSDDPAYFSGYVQDNYHAVHDALDLTESDLRTLAENSFMASFITPEQRREYLAMLNGIKPPSPDL